MGLTLVKHMKHGHSTRSLRTPTYQSWAAMKDRAGNDRVGYGHVHICDRWRTFAYFLSDMGERPQGTTLDRFPNQGGDYEPGNCRWATSKQQADNRRVTTMLTRDGRTMCARDWARELGIPKTTFYRRLASGALSF